MRVRLATLGACLLLAVVAIAATGCGATLDPVAEAATRTSDASTFRFAMDMRLVADGQSVPMTMSGAVDTAANRLALGIDASKAAALGGDGAGVGRMTMVEDGLVMYMSGEAVTGRLPGGKAWVRIDLSKAASALGVDLSNMTGGQSDPRTSLEQLKEAGNVVEVGHDTIDGVDTTRYSVLVDMRKGLDTVKGAEREALQQLVDRLEQAGGRYVPADVWVDGDGYLRRFHMAMSNYLGSGSSFTLTMKLSAFGEPVAIAVPPADQVADLTDLFS